MSDELSSAQTNPASAPTVNFDGDNEMSIVEMELLAYGIPWWLIREAAASTRMAQGGDGTYAVDTSNEGDGCK